eukprot:evm.model.NODE_12897_length_10614_cov_40.798096.2
MMDKPAYPTAANVSIGVFRNGVLLSPFDMTYFPNETLSLTLVGILGEVTWETDGAPQPSKYRLPGGCSLGRWE